MQQSLKALLERLLAHEIDFVLIGGFAAAVHGSTLVTQDIDICTAITEDGVAKLRNALKDLHPWHRMNPTAKLSFIEHPADIRGINNIYLKTDFGVLDILSQVSPAGDFAAIKSRSIEIPLYGHRCRVISIEDLIRVKEAMNRPKDQLAVQELKLIQQRTKV
ncbi:MAG: nucleotidyltransferase [Oligoflexia bacterium]|nr:nucleotidyltransferase [Oligoflexia bacterium]